MICAYKRVGVMSLEELLGMLAHEAIKHMCERSCTNFLRAKLLLTRVCENKNVGNSLARAGEGGPVTIRSSVSKITRNLYRVHYAPQEATPPFRQ